MYRGYRTGEDDGRDYAHGDPAAVRAMMGGLWEDRRSFVGESERGARGCDQIRATRPIPSRAVPIAPAPALARPSALGATRIAREGPRRSSHAPGAAQPCAIGRCAGPLAMDAVIVATAIPLLAPYGANAHDHHQACP